MSTARTYSPPGETCELSIIMPCLNEAATLGTCIAKATVFLNRHNIDGEIVVADNGSIDGSQDIARRLGARVVDVSSPGYGAALSGGIQAAMGSLVIIGDADDSYDFENLERFVERLRAGDDLVMGNRFEGGIEPGAMRFLHRYVGNPVLSYLGRAIFGSPVRDFHCGLRGFRKSAIAALNLQTAGMEFASEMVVKATLHGLRISEVPTTLSVDGRNRAPHLRTWHDGWRHLRFLLVYSPRWLFLVPGLLLLVAGSSAMALLIPQSRTIGGLSFDVTTMLYSGAAVVVGAQCIIFAICSKLYATQAGLHPPDRNIEEFLRFFTLERGLAVSVFLMLLGIAASFFALNFWSQRSFGALDPERILRITIPAVSAIALGVQLFFASFFLWLLRQGCEPSVGA